MQYAVQPGDSVWSIAARFADNSARWGELVAANPHKRRSRDGNFAALAEGEILTLPSRWRGTFLGIEAAGDLEVRPPRPLVTNGATELVKWVSDGHGGEYTTDLRYYRTPQNHDPNSEWWSDRAWDLWLDMAAELKADPRGLLLVSFSESGGLPWIVGPYKGKPFAWGLYQITPKAHAHTGLPTSEYERFMQLNYAPHTAEQQIPFMRNYWLTLSKYNRKGAGFAGLDSMGLYAYNAAPAMLGAGAVLPETVLYSEVDDPKRYPPSNYDGNRVLDRNKDGRVTVAELGEVLRIVERRPVFQLAARRLAQAAARRGLSRPESELRPPSPRPSAPLPKSPATRIASAGLGPVAIILGLAWLLGDQ